MPRASGASGTRWSCLFLVRVPRICHAAPAGLAMSCSSTRDMPAISPMRQPVRRASRKPRRSIP